MDVKRYESLEDIEGPITLKDLIHLVRAEGWKFEDAKIEAYDEDYGGRTGITVYREWDDGVLPPVPQPLRPSAPSDVQFNPDLVDLPDIGATNADPVHPTYGPTAPFRVYVEPKGKPTIRQTLQRWSARFQAAREDENDAHQD